MNLLSLADFDPKDEESTRLFMDSNDMAHNTIFLALLSQNIVISRYPLYTLSGKIDRDWLMVHNMTHIAESQALGLPDPVGLDPVDPSDEDQMHDWATNHFLDHELKALALNL